MQRSAVSMHACDVQAKDAERQQLAEKVAEFEKKNSISVLPDRIRSRKPTPIFNSAIAIAPTRRAHAATEKEDIELAVRQLSEVTIMGISIRRTAADIAVILKQRGYKLESASVERVATKLGITLKK